MTAKIKFVIVNAVFILAAAHVAVSAAATSDNMGLTREQVRAEVIRARAAGELDVNETNYPRAQKETSIVTREEVKAELARARHAGELDVTEANYPFIPKGDSSQLTRERVRWDVEQARNTSELDWVDTTYPLTIHAMRGY